MKNTLTLLLAILCLAGAVTAGHSSAPAGEPSYLSTQDAALRQADQLEQEQRYEEAIRIYENLINTGTGRDLRWTAYLFFRTANAQAASGDRIGAVESVGAAVNLDSEEPSYRAFQAELAGAKKSATYRARRNTGSARKLISTNGVLHIFVYGRNTEPWDSVEQEKTCRSVEAADHWFQQHAAQAGLVPLVFMHRFLSLPEEPFWRRVPVPESESSRDFRKSWSQAVLLRFQAGSYAELFDRVFDGMALDNRSVVFHVQRRGISLATLPRPRFSSSDLEGALVSSERTEWINLYEAVSYAREYLSVYGADDLFDKVPDPAVPENEIMNYGAHRLDQCHLCPLTQYAIGWTDRPPRLTHLKLAKKGNHR